MQIGWRGTLLITSIALAAGALIQRQWDDGYIERLKTEQKVVTKNKIVTVVKEVVKPDGTKETETTTTDNSTKTEKNSSDSLISRPALKTWLVGAAMSSERIYTLHVQRQVLGPIWLGAYGNTAQQVGLSLGVLF